MAFLKKKISIFFFGNVNLTILYIILINFLYIDQKESAYTTR